jgi:hypothetical protein
MLGALVETVKARFNLRWIPEFLTGARDAYREGGPRAVIKRFGWRILAILFVYYLVRDSILYLLLPYLIARGMFS